MGGSTLCNFPFLIFGESRSPFVFNDPRARSRPQTFEKWEPPYFRGAPTSSGLEARRRPRVSEHSTASKEQFWLVESALPVHFSAAAPCNS